MRLHTLCICSLIGGAMWAGLILLFGLVGALAIIGAGCLACTLPDSFYDFVTGRG